MLLVGNSYCHVHHSWVLLQKHFPLCVVYRIYTVLIWTVEKHGLPPLPASSSSLYIHYLWFCLFTCSLMGESIRFFPVCGQRPHEVLACLNLRTGTFDLFIRVHQIGIVVLYLFTSIQGNWWLWFPWSVEDWKIQPNFEIYTLN